MTEPTKLSYTISEAAEAVGVCKASIWKRIKDGELETFKWCGRTLIPAASLQAYLARRDPPKRKPWVPDPPEWAYREPSCGVYLLLQDGVVAYVGRSTTLVARIRAHERSGRPFDEVRVIPCDLATAVWLERELVRTLRPAQNLLRYKHHAQLLDEAMRREGLQ